MEIKELLHGVHLLFTFGVGYYLGTERDPGTDPVPCK